MVGAKTKTMKLWKNYETMKLWLGNESTARRSRGLFKIFSRSIRSRQNVLQEPYQKTRHAPRRPNKKRLLRERFRTVAKRKNALAKKTAFSKHAALIDKTKNVAFTKDSEDPTRPLGRRTKQTTSPTTLVRKPPASIARTEELPFCRDVFRRPRRALNRRTKKRSR